MGRNPNIFDGLVTDENSTTELLCKLMQFAAFRRPLLARLLHDTCASKIAFDDISTQVNLSEDSGRPDIIIRNGEVCVFIEVKVTEYRGLTPKQPGSYFSSLSKESAPERWLVFLVPRNWEERPDLESSLERLKANNRGISTNIVDWGEVIGLIEENDLAEMNPFLDEFSKLLKARFMPEPIAFSTKEVFMLFSKDFPAALSKLDQLIDQIRKKSGSYKLDQSFQ